MNPHLDPQQRHIANVLNPNHKAHEKHLCDMCPRKDDVNAMQLKWIGKDNNISSVAPGRVLWVCPECLEKKCSKST